MNQSASELESGEPSTRRAEDCSDGDSERASGVAVLHYAVIAVVYGFFALKALLEFNPQWDFLAYHLPHALALFGRTTYEPEPFLQRMNAAWPPLAHLVQGTLVLLTGRISAANSVNAVLFFIVVGLLWRELGDYISWRWFLTALLAVPLFLFHFVSGYIDLFANLWIFLAWGSLVALELSPDLKTQKRALVLLVVGIFGAVFSKLQMWPLAAIIVIYCAVRLYFMRLEKKLSPKAALLTLGVLLVTSSFWPIRNVFIYKNPTYPVRFPVAGSLFPNFTRTESSERDLPEYLHGRATPITFAHSVLELGRFKTEESFRFWLDQSVASGAKSPLHRMGGWFVGTVLLFIAAWALCVWGKMLPGGPTVLFGALVVATAFIPQSHELRYWFYNPLISAVAFGRVMKVVPKQLALLLAALLSMSAVYVIVVTDQLHLDTRQAAEYAPPDAVSFWEAQRNGVAPGPFEVCGKMPNTIFWAGPTFNEFPVRGCLGGASG